MKVAIDWREVGFHTKEWLILFSKISYRSVRRHPFVAGMLVFFVLLYRYSPAVFFFLLSNSPVIICTAVLLGTLLSFGQPHIPNVTEEEEVESRQDVSSLEVVGGVDHVVVEKDVNSELQTPLLYEERTTIESFDERVNNDINLNVDMIETEGVERLPTSKEEEGKKGGTSILVERQKDEKIIFGDPAGEFDVFFTPRRVEGMEELQMGTRYLERELHGNEMVEESTLDEAQEHIEGRSESYCRSNSRTVCFVTNDMDKSSEEKNLDDRDSEFKNVKDFEDDGKVPELNVPNTLLSSSVLPQVRVDHHDMFSDSSSDHSGSSSPDTSLVDLIPMLDKLYPLKATQPTSVEVSDTINAEASESYFSVADSHGDNTNDGDDKNDSFEVEKEGRRIQGGEHKEQKCISVVTWTEDDRNTVMDLGSSELERNQRLENLMARRRARRNQKIEEEEGLIDLQSEKDLIDLQSEDNMSMLDLDISTFSRVLEPVQIESPPVAPASENPRDLLCSGAEEMAASSVSSSSSAPLTPSGKWETFDLLHEHTDVKEMSVGEMLNHGEFMKSLNTNETLITGESTFKAIDHNKVATDMIPVYSTPEIESVSGTEGLFHVNPLVDMSLAEPKEQQKTGASSPSLSSYFHDHVTEVVGVVNTQQLYISDHQLEETVASIQNGSAKSRTSHGLQSESVCSVDCQKDCEMSHGEPTEVETSHLEICVVVETAMDNPSSPHEGDQSLEEVGPFEVRQEQDDYGVSVVHDLEEAASDAREEHLQPTTTFGHKISSSLHDIDFRGDSNVHKESIISFKEMKEKNVGVESVTVDSAENNVIPFNMSASKQQPGSNVAEQKHDCSSTSASLQGDETKFGVSIEEANVKKRSVRDDSSTSYKDRVQSEPLDGDNWVGEPVSDSGASSPKKSHSDESDLSHVTELELFMESRILQHHSIHSNTCIYASKLNFSGTDEQVCGENIVDKEGETIILPALTGSGNILVTADTFLAESIAGENGLSGESDHSHSGEAPLELKVAEANEEVYSRKEYTCTASSSLIAVGGMELWPLGTPELEEVNVIQVGSTAVQGHTIQASQTEQDSLSLEESSIEREKFTPVSDLSTWAQITAKELLVREDAKDHVCETQKPPSCSEKYARVAHTAELCQPLLSKDDEDFVHIDAHSYDLEEKSDSSFVISMSDGSSTADSQTIVVSDGAHVMGDESAVHPFSVDNGEGSKVVGSHGTGNFHVDFMQLSSDDAVSVGHTSACTTALTTSEPLETLKLLESVRTLGVEPKPSVFDDESPKHVSVPSSDATRQYSTEREFMGTSTVQETRISGNQSDITRISREYLGADNDNWVIGEGEVESVKDLDEDLLQELDSIGDFGVAEGMSSVQKPQKQMESGKESEEATETSSLTEMIILEAQSVEDIHLAFKHFKKGESSKLSEKQMESDKESEEAADTSSLTQMIVLEAQSVEDIHLAFKQFREGESSKSFSHRWVEHEKGSTLCEGGFAWEHLEVRYDESEAEVVEAESHRHMLNQLSQGDCEKHDSQADVKHFSGLPENHEMLQVLEARTLQDIDFALKQFNKQGPGEPSLSEPISDQDEHVASNSERLNLETIDLQSADVEVHVVKERESYKVGKKEPHNRENASTDDNDKVDDSSSKDMVANKVQKSKHKKSSSSSSTSSSSSSDSD